MDTLKGYEIAVNRVQHMSERRQVSSQIYLAVNTGIFGVLAFLVKDAGFRGWPLVAVSLPLFAVGTAACIVWYRIIAEFRDIIGWHYEKLREIEQSVLDCYNVCTEEWEELFKPQDGKTRFGFSRLEAWLPRLFVALYAVYLLGLMAAAVAGWR